MKIVIHSNGSVEFPDGLPPGLLLKSFQADDNNPNLFHPKFQPCCFRENRCRLSPCGKRGIFEWWCKHFKRNVTITDCRGCDVNSEAE